MVFGKYWQIVQVFLKNCTDADHFFEFCIIFLL